MVQIGAVCVANAVLYYELDVSAGGAQHLTSYYSLQVQALL